MTQAYLKLDLPISAPGPVLVRARKGDRVELVARHERAGTVRSSVVLG